VTWSKTSAYPFNPFEGDGSEHGLQAAKIEALQAINGYLKPEMRFAHALEDWN